MDDTLNLEDPFAVPTQHWHRLKIGGREQWRVKRSALEEYLDRARAETAAWVAAHPFSAQKGDD